MIQINEDELKEILINKLYLIFYDFTDVNDNSCNNLSVEYAEAIIKEISNNSSIESEAVT